MKQANLGAGPGWVIYLRVAPCLPVDSLKRTGEAALLCGTPPKVRHGRKVWRLIVR